MSSLPLFQYEGRYLTTSEIDLVKFIESKREEQRKARADREFEESLLVNSAKSVAARVEALRAANEANYREETKSSSNGVAKKSDEQKTTEKGAKPNHEKNPLLKKKEARVEEDEEDKEEEKASPSAPPVLSSEVLRPIRKRRLEEDEEVGVRSAQLLKYFTPEGILWDSVWSSVQEEEKLILVLDHHSYEQKNTLAIRYKANIDAIGWAFNITPAEDVHVTDIFLHFNPRYSKTALQLTDRQGTWGDASRHKLHSTDALLENEVQLVIQFHQQGFLIYANDHFVCFFPHRRDLHPHTNLKLVFMTADDNGRPYDVAVQKVWWGHVNLGAEILSPSIRTAMERAFEDSPLSVVNPMPPRTLIISNLPKLEDLNELQGLEYALLDLFFEFEAQSVCMVRGAGMAYCRLPDVESMEKAMAALQGALISIGEDEEVAIHQFVIHLQPMLSVS